MLLSNPCSVFLRTFCLHSLIPCNFYVKSKYIFRWGTKKICGETETSLSQMRLPERADWIEILAIEREPEAKLLLGGRVRHRGTATDGGGVFVSQHELHFQILTKLYCPTGSGGVRTATRKILRRLSPILHGKQGSMLERFCLCLAGKEDRSQTKGMIKGAVTDIFDNRQT